MSLPKSENSLEKETDDTSSPVDDIAEKRQIVRKNNDSKLDAYGREKITRRFGVGLAESEFKLYSGVAEVLWKSKLIKAPTLYYFSKYAMKSLTELALATAKVAQEQAKAIQGAQK